MRVLIESGKSDKVAPSKMNFEDIKKLIQDPMERVVVVEEGEPVFVVMGYPAYRAIKPVTPKAVLGSTLPSETADEVEELVNAELEAQRMRAKELAAKMAMAAPQAEQELPTATTSFPDPSRIRLEDLPL